MLCAMSKTVHEPHKIFFETLGNDARWKIVHLLRHKPLCVTEIAKRLGYEQSLVSHHLRRLETCGFLSFQKNGKERIYRLNTKTIKPLLALVDKHINAFCKKVCTQCK